MLQIRNLSNLFQKRLIRPLYAHTQATPWAGTLDPSLRNADGSFRAPLAADTLPVARSADAFTHQGGLVPLDDVKDENNIGVWYGPGAQFELLAPAFNDTGLAAAYAAATPGAPVLLYAGADGRLAQASALVGGDAVDKIPVAELVQRSSAAKIQIKLLV
jgi:hypothetical protein